jgi:hypothetical protein
MAQGVHSVLLLGELSIYQSQQGTDNAEVNVMMVLKLQLLLLQDTRQGV